MAALLNYVVNPFAQYGPRLLRPVVQLSRQEKVELLDRYQLAPEGLILGSSRVTKIEPRHLQAETGQTFFNAGVNYAQQEDSLAWFRYYQDVFQRSPKTIVLGLDVASFSPRARADARLLNHAVLSSQIPDVLRRRDRFSRWSELLSWHQTRESLRSLKIALGNDYPAPVETYQSDGLKVYLKRETEIAAGAYDFEDALAFNLREYEHLLSNFDQLAIERVVLFERLVEACQRAGTRLLVFLSPLHPRLHAHVARRTEYESRKRELINYLRQRATETGFVFCDLSTLESFDGDPREFFDGIHPGVANTRRMMDKLLRQPAGTGAYVIQ